MEPNNQEGKTIVNSFHAEGWAKFPGFLKETTLATIKNEVSRLVNNDVPNDQCLYYYEETNGISLTRLSRIERVWELLPSLSNGPIGSDMLDLASKCVSEPAILFKDKINIRWPGSVGYAAHQDTAAGWLDYCSTFVSIVITLHVSNEEAGGFAVAGGQHRAGRFANTKGKMDNDNFESLSPIYVPLAPGDLLLLDGEVPHKTFTNTTAEQLSHLIITFNRLSEGDQRSRYYAAKVKAFTRDEDSKYAFRVFDFNQ